MVNFGLLAAEIMSLVWGSPPNFNGFHVLAFTARHCYSGRQLNYAALNRGRHYVRQAAITLGIGPHSSLTLLYELPVTTVETMHNVGRPSGWKLTRNIANILAMAALRSKCGNYTFILWFPISFSSIFFYSSPNLSRCRLDAYHTSTYGVALVRI